MLRGARWLVVVGLGLSWGCGSPAAPTAGPDDARTITATASATAGVSSQTLGGRIRVRPAPGDDGVIVLQGRETIAINGSDERTANPDSTLHLIVNWGDGPNERVGCGPCRLEHTYASAGSYTVEATIDDGAAPVSQQYRVEVKPVREPSEKVILFSAADAFLPFGGSTTLTWVVTGGTGLSISPGVGAVASEGSVTVTPAAGTTTYILSGQSALGPFTRQVTVTVGNFADFSFAPTTLSVGQTGHLSFTAFPGATGGGVASCGFLNLTFTSFTLSGGDFHYTPTAPGTCNVVVTYVSPSGTSAITTLVTVN